VWEGGSLCGKVMLRVDILDLDIERIKAFIHFTPGVYRCVL
jgi:hypothetical protein